MNILGQASLIREEQTAPGQMSGSKYIVTLTHPERVSNIYSYPPICLNWVEYHYKKKNLAFIKKFFINANFFLFIMVFYPV